MNRAHKQKWRILAGAWAAAAFFAWPILKHRVIPTDWEWRTTLALILGYGFAVFLLSRFYRAESHRLGRSQNLILAILIFLLTAFVNQIHYYFIDQGSLFPYATNLVWQERLQRDVINLSPAVLPHSYRFLPNGIVLWMQLCRVDFHVARDIYRLVFGLLLFYAIYRYARLYTNYLGGLLAMLLVAVAFPISFEDYAGQLTDPMSHLSFVLAFIFLQTGDFEYFISTLLIGSLAKETILALTGYYLLFCRNEKRYVTKSLALCIGTLVSYFGVRLLVLHEFLHYRQVSAGLTPDHIAKNLHGSGWLLTILVLLGGYASFLVLGWKETPKTLKYLLLYLTPILIGTNLVIGWLHEARNYMPSVFALAVIAARYISRRCAPDDPTSYGIRR